ncbi:uroporphyrinogen-III synthase [Crenothrix sp.]|uniref:uroporphyrinogen-III synthase n=1 Tax=Crenothrix sp. TaxID=3100433 RepID=UPI00374D7325
MKPLNGARILVTRPVDQANKLSELIAEHGGEAICLPTVAIVEHEDRVNIQKKMANLSEFQWLVFISANAVNFAVKANSGKIPHNHSLGVVAIGPATAQALQSAGMAVDLMPTELHSSEALLAMPQMQAIDGQCFLIVRGSGGREDLASSLRARGAKVNYLEVYNRIIPRVDNSYVLALLTTNTLDVVTATSVEILQNLVVIIGAEAHQQLLKVPLVVMSERIRCVAVEMGFERVAVTKHPSDTAILETVTTYVTGA